MMLNKLFKDIPVTTIALGYLFLCGGLYIIGFWGTFSIDISNLINISDIPKSFILPFVISNGTYLFQMFINIVTVNKEQENLNVVQTKPVKKNTFLRRFWRVTFSIDTLLLIAAYFIITRFRDYHLNALFWILSGQGFALLLSIKVEHIRMVKNAIPYPYVRWYIILLFINTPIMSFVIGKSKAVSISSNKTIIYIKNSGVAPSTFGKDSSSAKLIGFVGDKLIASSSDNSRFYILNQSSMNSIVLEDKSPKDSTK